jgi:hypothetical protein
MLHAGICTWEHCTHVLNASAHHPRDYLQEALGKVEAAWDDPVLRKMSINAWVGTLAIENDTAYCLRSSACQADLEPLGNGERLKIQTTYGDKGEAIYDYVFSTLLERGGAGFRPIHDITLAHEATLLAQALAILAKLKVPPRRVYELKLTAFSSTLGCAQRPRYRRPWQRPHSRGLGIAAEPRSRAASSPKAA